MMGLLRSDLKNSCGLFQDAGRNPVAVQGNITFSAPHEVSVVSAGLYASRHTASRRCFRHRIDRHHRGASRWAPGNQSSRIAFMDIRRTRFTLADSTHSPRHPLFPTFRLPTVLTLIHPRHFYDSRVSWGVPQLQTRSSGAGNPR